jgi:hypothetical protein
VSSEIERIANEVMSRPDFDWLYETFGKAPAGQPESPYISGNAAFSVNIRPARKVPRPTRFLIDE